LNTVPVADTMRTALQAAFLTAALFLALPYVHLIVPPAPPVADLLEIPRAHLPAPPPLPPPVPLEAASEPPPVVRPELTMPAVPVVPLKPVLDFDFALGGIGGDFSLAFTVADDGGAAGGAAVFELGDVDRVPQALAQMRPLYPAHARRRRIEGDVTVLFTVTAEGRTGGVQVLSSTPEDVFTESAVRAVDRWRFTPAMKGGQAVPVRVRQVIRFRMED